MLAGDEGGEGEVGLVVALDKGGGTGGGELVADAHAGRGSGDFSAGILQG